MKMTRELSQHSSGETARADEACPIRAPNGRIADAYDYAEALRDPSDPLNRQLAAWLRQSRHNLRDLRGWLEFNRMLLDNPASGEFSQLSEEELCALARQGFREIDFVIVINEDKRESLK